MIAPSVDPGRVRRVIAPLRAAATSPSIARAVLAFGGFTMAEWAVWIAMLVYSYERGGAAAAGIVAVIQLLPSAVLSPLIGGFGDRLPRERMLVASYLGQSAGMAVTAIALAASADFAVVVALATLTTIAIGMTRPAHFALLPALARTADEVTAANVASSTIQNVAILVAPALAGALLAVSGAAAVFGVTAVATGVAAILVATIRTERMELAAPTRPEAAGDASGAADSDGAAAAATEPDEPEMGLIDGLRLLRSHVGSRIDRGADRGRQHRRGVTRRHRRGPRARSAAGRVTQASACWDRQWVWAA